MTDKTVARRVVQGAIVALVAVVAGGCQTVSYFSAWKAHGGSVDGAYVVPVLPPAATADYEFVGVVSAVGTVEAFDVFGVVASPSIDAATAMDLAIKSGLMTAAQKEGADALTNIVVSDVVAYPGCSSFGGFLPYSHANVLVSATALKKKGGAGKVP